MLSPAVVRGFVGISELILNGTCIAPTSAELGVLEDQKMKLDLACGQHCREGFLGVDISAPGARYKVDLINGAWPWPENVIEELHCSHFIEHIPSEDSLTGQDRLLRFFDSCWRILVPQGKITLVWPALQSVRAFMDPTHRRFIPLETMNYLSREWREKVGLSHYDVRCNFRLVSATLSVCEGGSVELARPAWNIAEDYTVVLEKIP